MTTLGVRFDPHVRGTTFDYSTTMGNGFTAEMFQGGIRCTLRTRYPASSVVSDADAVAHGDIDSGNVIAAGTALRIRFLDSKLWPTGVIYWDVEGAVNVDGTDVRCIASGSVEILPDVTRSN